MEVSQKAPHMRRMVSLSAPFMPSRLTTVPAGYAYCAIASLSFLRRLPDPSCAFSQSRPTTNGSAHTPLPGLTNFPATVRWLVSRQVEYKVDEEEDDHAENHINPLQDKREALTGMHDAVEPPSVAGLSLHEKHFVGFNGRCNKGADTCYAFWVGGSLDACKSLSTWSNFG